MTIAATASASPIHLTTPRLAMNQYPPTMITAAPSRATTVRVSPVSPSSAMITISAATSAAHAALASQRRLAGIDGGAAPFRSDSVLTSGFQVVSNRWG